MCDYEEMEEWIERWRARASTKSLGGEAEDLPKVIPNPLGTSEASRRGRLALRQ